MKKYFLLMMFMVFAFFANAAGVAVDVDATKVNTWFQFVMDNWESGIYPILAWLVYRWIPTTKADVVMKIIGYVKQIIVFILADRKKGGGLHKKE